jgi:cobalamin synthase
MIMTTNRTPVRFSMRALLVTLTASCVVLGVLQWVLPKDIPIEYRIAFSIMIAALLAYAAYLICHAKRHPWKSPEDFVTVKVDAKWKRRVKSPIIIGPVATFTGAAITFAPLYLFSCGQAEEFGILEWFAVPLCFLVIYFVPLFYMSLASEVIAELVKSGTTTDNFDAEACGGDQIAIPAVSPGGG